MTSQQILALYDQEERIAAEPFGMKREATTGMVRQVDLRGKMSCIIYSRYPSDKLDAAIVEQATYFNDLGHAVEWKVFSHDSPPELPPRLQAHGFKPGPPEALMVLDVQAAPRKLLAPHTHVVRRIVDDAGIQDLAASRGAMEEEEARIIERVASDLRERRSELSVYVVYAANKPVSSAWIYFSARGSFAGLWGGGTLEEYRGQGFYAALVAARVQEAQKRGKRFVTIDAGPMSRPIVERLGFQLVGFTTPFVLALTRRCAT